MSSRYFGTTIVLLLILATAIRGQDPTKEPWRIQGTWEVVGHSHRGRNAPPENLKDKRIIIHDGRLKFTGPNTDPETEFQIELDIAAKPRIIDLIDSEDKDKRNPLRGIFKLDGDRLTIALDPHVKNSVRPREFVSPIDSDVMIWVLQRVKP